MHYILFAFLSVIWGSNFILIKKATLAFGPISIGGGRVFGGAVVLGIAWWMGRKPWPIRRSELGSVALLVLFAYIWPFCALPWLIKRNGGAFMGLMISLVPLLTILVSIPMLRIYPTRNQIVGVLGGLGFLCLLMTDGVRRSIPLGDLGLAVSVPLCYAIANTHLKRTLSGIPALGLSFVALALASIVIVPIALLLPSEAVQFDENFGLAASSLTVSSLLATGVATHVFYKLIQEQGPLFAGLTAYLIPLGTIIWGWVDREEITAIQLVALAGILTMVTLVRAKAVAPATEIRGSGNT
ncbi:MAG: DMT family transporter [Verrucomicrobia bacterium]|nr:DMT family transporter [Verrucomicrobiota bacterium]